MDKELLNYPVVILPGWLLPAAKYESLAGALTSKGFTTYVAEFPGFKSRSLQEVLNLTDYVRYLNKFLKQRKLSRVIFIAHSFGGRVALKLVSQNPQIAKALILSGTPGFPEVGNWRLIFTRLMTFLGKPITYIPPFIFFRRQIKSFVYRSNRSADYLKVTGALKKTFQNIIREQLINYMQKIRVPTLLLWGEKDVLVSVKTARRMQNLIKNSQLVVVPETGHMLVYRNPEVVVAKVISFLRNIKET